MRNRLFGALVLLALLNGCPSLAAGPNDFFGGVLPGALGSLEDKDEKPSNAPAAESAPAAAPEAKSEKPAPAQASGGSNAGDFTDDEKRMRGKYKARLKNAKDLIAKGEAMMSKAPNHDDKAFKKGRILKEIGEKDMAELKSNNPFADEIDRLDKKKKDNTPESL